MINGPNLQSVLLIDVAPAHASVISRILESEKNLLKPTHSAVAETDVPDYLQQSSARGDVPAVIFVGPRVKSLGAIVNAVQRLTPSSHIFFIEDDTTRDKIPRRLSHLPLSGLHWSTANLTDFGPGEDAFAEAVSQAAQASRQRQQLRSTLDRANQQIHTYRTTEHRQQRPSISDYYLTNFLAHAQDAVVAMDARWQILYWSAGAERLFGLSGKKLVGAAARTLPFWTDELEKGLARIPGEADTLTVETSVEHSGREIAIESVCSAVHDEEGRFIGTSLIIRDVSKRQQMLEAERAEHSKTTRILETERRHLRNLFKQAPGFIAVTEGPQHVFEVVNEAYIQIIGDRSILGKPAAEALPEMQGQEFLTLLDQVYTRREPYVGRGMAVRIQRKPDADMETRFVDFVFQPIIHKGGAITGIFCQGTDVTEHRLTQKKLAAHQKNLEELVEERTEELRASQHALQQSQKLEAIGKLTGGVAHDFNNVLQIISSSLQLLQLRQKKEETAPIQKYINTAVDAVERGSRLSSQLLAFARRQPLRPTTINLGRVLRRMDDLLRRALGEAVEIETVVAGGLWNAMVDPHQLENVVLNLAINARDAMPEGGKLTLEVGNSMLDDRYVLNEPEVPAGQYVLLAVSDTGKGMTAEVMERVFDPFFTTKKEGEGTGLGLSMAYGFTKQSGGHIRIYSEPGSGTTIKIYLPRSFEAEAELPHFAPGPASGGSETILVVEDDYAVRETAVLILRDLGYTVLQAHDGQSALNVLKSGVRVDMLFTDVVMPGPVLSTELATAATQMLPDIVVLFTSGYTQNAIVHGGRLDPGVELLSKPYHRDELARKVRQLFDNRPRRQQQEKVSEPEDELFSSAPESLRVLVVEDDIDSQSAVCELLAALGHQATGVTSAEDALEALGSPRFHVLLTDVNLPGLSGIQLVKKARERHAALRIIVASGYGADFKENISPQPVILPKPFDLEGLKRALALATSR